VQGIRYLFYADLVEIDPVPGVEETLSTIDKRQTSDLLYGGTVTRQAKENLSLYNLPGVAMFFFKVAGWICRWASARFGRRARWYRKPR
jgi:hypothetical protein